ncbi:MAG: glycoside hydrolase family 6 protein [Acidobacteriota bacterium]|nr:glycoside hydrolase family 6 protein [Acidobacteriota bacterium]
MLLIAASPALADGSGQHGSGGSKAGVYFSSAVYNASENVGKFAVTIERSDTSGSETVHYGVTNKSSEVGKNFDKVPNSTAVFAPGQGTYTFNVTINDQGINGPKRTARAYLYGASPAPLGKPSKATINLLQNDPLATPDPTNPLGYAQAPTNGDPLQFVNWYVFGNQSPAGAAIARVSRSNPGWAPALHRIAFSPGSGSYRFWMWNQPASKLASTVEKYLADAELAQPNTTVALSTYSLVHGACQSPAAIKTRFENWITQLAHGIGNFRVVLYLEEDSLTETHCLDQPALQTRLHELAYAVRALSADPHALVYLEGGSPDGWLSARATADYLNQADIAQAQGFFVNATHNEWTTTDVHYGQQIARLTGGKHFIVQTDDNGRGPLIPTNRQASGNEVLCNPAGRGTGPLSWDTGYAYTDGFLWFNNPGNSDGPCGAGDPPVAQFWPAYAVGLVQNGTSQVTGPHFDLLRSSTNE